MGEIHEVFVLALSLVWFAGATPEANFLEVCFGRIPCGNFLTKAASKKSRPPSGNFRPKLGKKKTMTMTKIPSQKNCCTYGHGPLNICSEGGEKG